MEFYADSFPAPYELPADALAVLVFREHDMPPRYEFVCVVTGAATLADVKDPLGVQFPWLSGLPVLITKIGGTAARVRRLRVNQSVSTAVAEEQVVAPA